MKPCYGLHSWLTIKLVFDEGKFCICCAKMLSRNTKQK